MRRTINDIIAENGSLPCNNSENNKINKNTKMCMRQCQINSDFNKKTKGTSVHTINLSILAEFEAQEIPGN